MYIQPILTPNPRVGKRQRVVMMATLFTPVGATRVRLRDISSTGVHIFADSPMISDCDALLKRGSLFVAARVVWGEGKEAGLEFYRELSAKEVEAVFN